MKINMLLVVEGNRFLRAYSEDRNVSVKFVSVPFMRTQQGEILVDELLRQRLRGIWHRTYTEGYQYTMHAIHDVKPEDIVARDLEMAVLRTIERHEVRK